MKRFIQSLFTDGNWDGDVTKLFGIALIIAGVVGWFMGRDPVFIVGFGAALAASGKFSSQG